MEVQQSLSSNRKLQWRRVPPASSVVAAVCSASEFTFGLLLDFRKHRTILSFINNAVSFVSAPISPLSLPQPGTHETSNWTNKLRAVADFNQSAASVEEALSSPDSRCYLLMHERGFLSSPSQGRKKCSKVKCKKNWIEKYMLCRNSESNKLTFSEYFCSKL